MAQIKLSDLGQDIFMSRYSYPGETKWSERAKVIARTVASAENDEDVEKYEKKFYDVLTTGDFIPGGRIIFGSGRRNQGLLNCFVLEPGDSVPSISKLLGDVYTISCAGGGIGFNFSKIRPKGDDISNIKYSSPGSVELMRLVNQIGEHVRAGKNRRSALLATLEVTHPDLMEFLHVKLDKGELTNFNISVSITDRFMEAVELDESWYFTFNNKQYYVYKFLLTNNELSTVEEVQVVGTDEEDALGRANEQYKKDWNDEFSFIEKYDMRAREIWDIIWKNAVESGEPGVLNYDLANKHTNVSYFENLCATNPCGEINLPKGGNCCLGNVNLAHMVKEDGSDLDWKRLARAVRLGVRFLDNVLSINTFPTEDCQKAGLASRRIGLGVTGLHYMLIKLNIRYGTEKCLEFLDRLFSTIRDEAYKQSIYLSRDKSPFPEFDYGKYLREDFAKTLPARVRMLIKRYGIRNAVMLTIPPTGTISMLMGVSTGIEPVFAAMYKRRYREGGAIKETVVVDPMFQQWYDEDKPLGAFVGAYDVTPEDHIRVQATIQRYIDSAISKTINLPKDYKNEDLNDLASDYMPYLKGMTVYKAGSRENEPLEAIPLTQENINRYMKESAESEMASGDACSLTGGGCGG